MKVFCDFDGTTARNDVGSLLFRTFGGDRCHAIVQKWIEGQISSKQCLLEECRLTSVSLDELEDFADAQELDPHFMAFFEFCQSHDIELEIVSDGLDFYIECILQNYGLDSKIPVRANHIRFQNGNRIVPEFPYYEQGCGQCANCKGVHVREARPEHDTLVYVGDGLSDRCGAEAADVVFAKFGRDLLPYCEHHGIPVTPFTDFADVLRAVRRMLNREG